MINKLNITINPSITKSDFCYDCAASFIKTESCIYQHQLDYEFIRRAKKAKVNYWISKPWFSEFKKKNPNFEGSIPNPMNEPFRGHFLCQHGNLCLNGGLRILVNDMVDDFNIDLRKSPGTISRILLI